MVPSADDITRKPLHPPIYQETERDPLRRRFWLLWQALKYGSSMAEALKIAEEIEAFLVVGAASCSSHDTPNKVAAAPLEAPHGKPREMPQAVPSLLNPENKAELSARLEACNSNAQLAVEFGLTPRQVQGFRMQVGRRAKSKIAAVNPQRQAATSAPGIEEVVRYLRQQGDVVVA